MKLHETIEGSAILLDGASFTVKSSAILYWYDCPIQIVAKCADGRDLVITRMDDDRADRIETMLALPLLPGEFDRALTQDAVKGDNIGLIAASRGGLLMKVDYNGKVVDETPIDGKRALLYWQS